MGGATNPAGLHARLLHVARRSVKILKHEAFRGEPGYIDLFGRTLSRAEGPRPEELGAAWLKHVVTACSIDVDAIVMPHSGNVPLADRVCADLGIHLITAKTRERSKAEGEMKRPAEVNLEGLAEFLEERQRDFPKLRVVGFDDSCRNGGGMTETLEQLNGLIANEPATYPIECVTDVVVLFRRVQRTGALKLGPGVSLHALLSFDNDDIMRLSRVPLADDAKAYEAYVDDFMTDVSTMPWLATSAELRAADVRAEGPRGSAEATHEEA